MNRLLAIGLLLVAAIALIGDANAAQQILIDPGFEQSIVTLSPSAICAPPHPVGCRDVSSITLLTSTTRATSTTSTSALRPTTSASTFKPHDGSNYITFGGLGMAHTDFLGERVTIPDVKRATLKFYLRVATKEHGRAADVLRVEIRSESGALLRTLATYSSAEASDDYEEETIDVSRYAGMTIRIVFVATEDLSRPTWFLLDDLTLTVSK